MTTPHGEQLLQITDLDVTFASRDGAIRAVRGVTLDVLPGEVLGIVGESGSGKSVTMLAALGLLPATATISGSVRFRGEELLGLPDDELRRYRGRRIGMIFQDPLTSLNPVLTIGQQIGGAVAAHTGRQRSAALRERAIELLDLVSIPEPHRRVDGYPHELSGGMRQRAMIALAIANEPDVLIADEPTTALDVTIQAQILDVLRTIQRERGLSIVLITHDLGVIAGMADRLAVMYSGRVVEQGVVGEVYAASSHPYTRGLIGCLPRLDRRDADISPIAGAPPSAAALPTGCAFHPRCPEAIDVCAVVDPVLEPARSTRSACHRSMELGDLRTETSTPVSVGVADSAAAPGVPTGAEEDASPAIPAAGNTNVSTAQNEAREPILEVVDLEKRFDVRSTGLLRRVVGHVDAVSGVSFDLRPGEVLALVGESGCGKSTTGRCILRLVEPNAGQVRYDGKNVLTKSRAEMRQLRRRLQLVFQDPFSSLNPRMTVGDIIAEPLVVHGMGAAEARERAGELLELVQLQAQFASRFPHQFSGGQRQRVSLARSLALEPDVLVLDEPVSALDVSIQAGIIQLLEQLQDRLDLAVVFIAHDLSVVRHVADVVAVMYLGRIVEIGPNDEIFERPTHPYTQALLSAVPIPDPAVERSRRRILLTGDVPSGTDPPSGCRFRTRCWKAVERCATEQPLLADPGLADPGRGHPVACHFPSLEVADSAAG